MWSMMRAHIKCSNATKNGEKNIKWMEEFFNFSNEIKKRFYSRILHDEYITINAIVDHLSWINCIWFYLFGRLETSVDTGYVFDLSIVHAMGKKLHKKTLFGDDS